MEFDINPYTSVGNIYFGIDRIEAIRILGKPEKSFKRNQFSVNKTDDFQKYSLFLNYDENMKVEALEFYQNNQGLSILGISLFVKQYDDLLNLLLKVDENIEEDETGFTSYLLGIGIYSPNKKQLKNSDVEGIIVFKKGYYG